MKPMILIAIFAFASAFADDVKKPAIALPLSAANFFQPIRPGFERNPEWPDHLTIETLSPDLAKFKAEILKHKWRFAFHCKSKPVSADFFAGTKLLDGFVNPGAEVVYTADGHYTREHFRYPDAVKSEKDADKVDITAHYRVFSPNREGLIEIEWDSIDLRHAFFALAHIKETDEYVIQSPHHLIPCMDGSPLTNILVPVDLLY